MNCGVTGQRREWRHKHLLPWLIVSCLVLCIHWSMIFYDSDTTVSTSNISKKYIMYIKSQSTRIYFRLKFIPFEFNPHFVRWTNFTSTTSHWVCTVSCFPLQLLDHVTDHIHAVSRRLYLLICGVELQLYSEGFVTRRWFVKCVVESTHECFWNCFATVYMRVILWTDVSFGTSWCSG
jgi:hypothetical protein